MSKKNNSVQPKRTPLIDHLEKLGLEPMPASIDEHIWISFCIFSKEKHFMFIDAQANSYSCSHCKSRHA
ncbi:MAG: hypothetical protein ACK5EW_09300 [Bacteroidota bacterium]